MTAVVMSREGIGPQDRVVGVQDDLHVLPLQQVIEHGPQPRLESHLHLPLQCLQVSLRLGRKSFQFSPLLLLLLLELRPGRLIGRPGQLEPGGIERLLLRPQVRIPLLLNGLKAGGFALGVNGLGHHALAE